MKIALGKKLIIIVNHKGEEHEVSDSMYNQNDYFLKFCILRSIVLTIQKVCRLDCIQVPWGHCGKHCYSVKKQLLSFQNKHLFVFNDKQSTQYQKKHFSLMYETFLTRRLCKSKTGHKSSLHCFFTRKTSFKLNLNWLKVFRCKPVFTQMVFDSRLQLCDPCNTAYNRKEKQEHFWNILWQALELLKGNKSIQVT